MTNQFRAFLEAGYPRLVSIVPPGSPISEKSTLFKRPGAVGKAPGIKRSDGTWQGYDWLKHVATEADLDAWNATGAGVGIRTGNGLVALDIDTLDEALAERAQQIALDHLGIAPIRVGRWPKRLLLFRVAETTSYRRVKFQGGLVELLSDDRQFVAHGIHPVTLKPYEWQPHAWPFDSLGEVTAEQLDDYFAAVAREFPAAEPVEVVGSAADRKTVDQGQLLGDLEDVTRAVEALPNSNETFPSYDDYIRVGAAIKGATQDEHEGLGLFLTWAAKWDGGENDPERVEADWQRIKPPYGVGAQYLYSLAAKHGGFSTGDAWFAASAGETNPFDQAPVETAPALEPIRWIDPAAWDGVEPPPREWEVDGWIPRRQVTLLYGEGGIGKTLAIHQYGICAAAGIPWLGQPTRQARVMAILCEDDEEELQRRHHDLLRALKLTNADLGGRFRFVSRTGENNLLAVVNRSTGALVPTDFYRQVRDDAVAWRADVTVADTIADTFGGSEIDRGHVNTFVKTILGGLAKATRGSVIALGHPSVAGRAEGRSGSTAWSNAARSRIYLRYPKGVEKGNIRELEGAKANYGPKGALLRLRWSRGHFETTAESKPIDLDAFKTASEGAAVAVCEGLGRPASLEQQEEAAVLAAVAAARRDGRAMNLSARSTAYAPKVLLREYADLLEDARAGEIEATLAGLLRSGRVRVATWRDAGQRKSLSGYEVVTAVSADNTSAPGVFN